MCRQIQLRRTMLKIIRTHRTACNRALYGMLHSQSLSLALWRSSTSTKKSSFSILRKYIRHKSTDLYEFRFVLGSQFGSWIEGVRRQFRRKVSKGFEVNFKVYPKCPTTYDTTSRSKICRSPCSPRHRMITPASSASLLVNGQF